MTNSTRDESLDLWILKTLESGSASEVEAARWIRSIDTVQFKSEILSEALEALAGKGLIESHWGFSNNSSRVRYYGLTAAGLQHLSTLQPHPRSTSL